MSDFYSASRSASSSWSSNQDSYRSSRKDRAAKAEASSTAAVAFINQAARLQYGWAPKAYSTGSKITKIIVNGSNDKNCLVPMELVPEALDHTFCVTAMDMVHPRVPHGVLLGEDVLASTTWTGETDLVAYAVPSCLLVPFGRLPIFGSITDEDVRKRFGALGAAEALWADSMAEAHRLFEPLGILLDNIKSTGSQQKYIDSGFGDIINVDANAPFVTSTVITEEEYPTEVAELKSRLGWLPPAPASSVPLPATVTPPGLAVPPAAPVKYVIRSKEDDSDDKETEYGQVRMLALNLAGTINWNTGQVSNPCLPVFSSSMKKIWSVKPASTRAKQLRSLLRSAFTSIPRDDDAALSSLITERSMHVFPLVLCNLILAGMWAVVPADSVVSEKNTVDVLAFAPQSRSSVSVQKLLFSEQGREVESLQNEVDSNLTQKRKVVDRVGSIATIHDVSRLVVNLLTKKGAIWDLTGPKPILYQVLMKYKRFFKEQRFGEWILVMASKQPQFAFVALQYVESSFVEVAKAGDDFVTLDCVERLDLDEINLRPYEQCVAVFIDFERAMLSLMRTNSFEQRVPSITPAAFDPATVPPKKVRVEEPRAQARVQPGPPDKPKRPRGGPATSTTDGAKGKGDFFCSSADLSSLSFKDVFPPGLTTTRYGFCLNWMVCGQTCSRPIGACRFSHGYLDKIEEPDRGLIMAHVMNNPKVWFNSKTVRNVTPEQRKKLGDEKGIYGA